MGKCIIVCNGDVESYELFKETFDKESFVICADGGTRHLRKVGIFPNIIMGDLDSSTFDDVKYFQDLGTEVKMFPSEKDYTDTELAFSEAVNLGFKRIIILACTGKRLDHTLANIFLLKKAVESGVECYIKDENNLLAMIKGDKNNICDYKNCEDFDHCKQCKECKEYYTNRIILKRKTSIKISLLPISKVCKGVSITGVKYPLNNETIAMGQTMGISNEFIENSAVVTIKEGLLLVILSKD